MESDIIFKTVAFGGFNKTDVMNYIKQMKDNEEELLKEIKTLKEQNNAFSTRLDYLDMTSSDHKKELAELEERHNLETERIKKEYEEKIQALQSRADNSQNAEIKIGSAMLDVRRYADLLLHETCDSVNSMAKSADEATEKTLSRMKDLSAGIKVFSDKVNSVLSDIIAENELLTGELLKFRGSLGIPFEKAVGNVQIEMPED